MDHVKKLIIECLMHQKNCGNLQQCHLVGPKSLMIWCQDLQLHLADGQRTAGRPQADRE